MTAEQQWNEWDNRTFHSTVHGVCDGARIAREAYKSALRKAIELAMTTSSSRSAEQYNNGLIKALELLDTVKPLDNPEKI